MEELNKNKQFCFLFIIFIIFSIVHIVYATITMRGMYCDGAFFMLEQLNNFSSNIYKVSYDETHTRVMILFLMQFPVMFAHGFLQVNDKFALMKIFSFSQFALPLLFLLWNFYLTKRTNRTDILFWNLFVYGAIICPFMIFSVVETIIGVMLNFILWNYLAANIEYKKKDIIFIIFLVTMMFGTYEYVALLGIIFFLAHFHYVVQEKSFKNQCVKTFIGLGALASAIYTISFMLKTDGEGGEILRFIGEATDFLPHLFELNSLFSVLTIVIVIFISFKKEKMSLLLNSFILILYVLCFLYLIRIPLLSVYPMWEQHLRTIPCWFIPLLFTSLLIKDMISAKVNDKKYTNLIIVALICCIFQTAWQMVDTYYWNQNIKYMKNELLSYNGVLYVPSEHEEISGFHNKQLRRYIWHGIFPVTSILFSEDYKQKTLLLSYDEPQDPGNGTFRSLLYVIDDKKMSVPFGTIIDIKNDYWDLTDCANSLYKYNKENNIKTDG